MAEMSRVRASEGEMRDASGDDGDDGDVDFGVVSDVDEAAEGPLGLDVAGVAAEIEEIVAFDNVDVEYGGSAPIWSRR